MASKRYSIVDKSVCVACGACENICPLGAIKVHKGCFAKVAMFGNMVFQTYLVASGSENLREAIKLFWTFRIPWGWTYSGSIFPDWVAQFSFGFYSLMLTSLLIGLIVMIFFKPRTWCAFCPMGTMTQAICKLRNRKRGK